MNKITTMTFSAEELQNLLRRALSLPHQGVMTIKGEAYFGEDLKPVTIAGAVSIVVEEFERKVP